MTQVQFDALIARLASDPPSPQHSPQPRRRRTPSGSLPSTASTSLRSSSLPQRRPATCQTPTWNQLQGGLGGSWLHLGLLTSPEAVPVRTNTERATSTTTGARWSGPCGFNLATGLH